MLMDLGDFVPSSTIDFKFPSRSAAAVPTTLAGSPALSVYKSNSTTQTTTGITLTVDFDSVTGLNHVRIDLSSDTTFYSAATEFDVVITTGTVSGVSVVGEVVAHFSILNRSAMIPVGRRNTLASATSTTATLDAGASATDGIYQDHLIWIIIGTGAGAVRTITGYVGSTKVATVDRAWTTTPDSTSQFILIPEPVGDVRFWAGKAVVAPNVDGYPKVDLAKINGTDASAVASAVDANMVSVNGTNVGCTLPTSGVVASQADVRGVGDNVNVSTFVPEVFKRPNSGTQNVRFTVEVRSYTGAMADADSAPTVAAADQDGTAKSSNLVDSTASPTTTMTKVATGQYELYYQVTSADLPGNIRLAITVVKNSVTKVYNAVAQILETSDAASVTLAAGQLVFKKNTAFSNFQFPMFDSTDHVTPKTGLTVTATRIIDSGSSASTTNSAAEVGTTGIYRINFSAADLNGGFITFKFTAPGADPRVISIAPQP